MKCHVSTENNNVHSCFGDPLKPHFNNALMFSIALSMRKRNCIELLLENSFSIIPH